MKTTSSSAPGSTKSIRSKSSLIQVPQYSGASFRERRPATDQDRDTVAEAIDHTYRDLFNRTGINLSRISDSLITGREKYDTSQESFSYQYGFVQQRYLQYLGK